MAFKLWMSGIVGMMLVYGCFAIYFSKKEKNTEESTQGGEN